MGGLLQLGVRFLDPSVGRFTQVDPVGDGLNWYAYCNNHITRKYDPTGKSLIDHIRRGLCVTACLIVYEASRVACGALISDKASCIALAWAAFGTCTAGCHKKNEECEKENWYVSGYGNTYYYGNGVYMAEVYMRSSKGHEGLCIYEYQQDGHGGFKLISINCRPL